MLFILFVVTVIQVKYSFIAVNLPLVCSVDYQVETQKEKKYPEIENIINIELYTAKIEPYTNMMLVL